MPSLNDNNQTSHPMEIVYHYYVRMHLCRIPSKLLGANLLLTTNCGCPPKDPLVPISDGKNVITCSGCLSNLKQ